MDKATDARGITLALDINAENTSETTSDAFMDSLKVSLAVSYFFFQTC